MGEDNSRKTVLTKCSTQIICFEIFLRGVDLWVRSKLRIDHAIIIEVMKMLMNKMEVEVK